MDTIAEYVTSSPQGLITLLAVIVVVLGIVFYRLHSSATTQTHFNNRWRIALGWFAVLTAAISLVLIFEWRDYAHCIFSYFDIAGECRSIVAVNGRQILTDSIISLVTGLAFAWFFFFRAPKD